MDYTNATKEQLLIEFRAMRNTLKKLDSDYYALQKQIVSRFGTDKQKSSWVPPPEAELFEMLLKDVVETEDK